MDTTRFSDSIDQLTTALSAVERTIAAHREDYLSGQVNTAAAYKKLVRSVRRKLSIQQQIDRLKYIAE